MLYFQYKHKFLCYKNSHPAITLVQYNRVIKYLWGQRLETACSMVPYFCVVGKASSFWPLNLLYNSNLLGKGIQVCLKNMNTNNSAFCEKHINTAVSYLLKFNIKTAGKETSDEMF